MGSKIMRLKQWGEEGMPKPDPSQFYPVHVLYKPGGFGGNNLFLESADLLIVRGMNPDPVMQQWAIQPVTRSLYIIEEKAIQRKFVEIKRQIRAARKAGDHKLEKQLNRMLKVKRAWSWVDMVKWPVVGMAGELVLVVEESGKFSRVSGMPLGFELPRLPDGRIDIAKARADYPFWLHMVWSKQGPQIKPVAKNGRAFIMPFFSTIGRRGTASGTDMWIRSDQLKPA